MPVRPALIRPCGVGVLGLALAVDAALGEPPEALHPVVWMGRGVSLLLPEDSPAAGAGTLLRGAAVAAAGGLLAAGTGRLAGGAADRLGPVVGGALKAAALSSLLALRALVDAARRVGTALEAGDDAAARHHLPWLVGRYTTARRAHIAELERQAENRRRDARAAVERAVAGERSSIARDLHDVISHHVSAIGVHAGAHWPVLKMHTLPPGQSSWSSHWPGPAETHAEIQSLQPGHDPVTQPTQIRP